MATKLNLELKVGIFAFIALIILTLAVFSISEIYIFRPGYHIKITFSFASGIDLGAVVRVAGIEAGEVRDIEMSYDKDKGEAKVTLLVWLNKDVKVPRDSVAYVSVLGLIGETYLEIVPGEDYAHLLKDGDMLVGRDPFSTETLMEAAHKVAANFDNILNSVDEVFDEETKMSLKEAIQNLDASMELMLKVTDKFDGVLDSVNEILDEETKVALQETIHNFHDISASLKVITGRLERGEGKLGAWLKPKRSYKKKSKPEESEPEEAQSAQPKQNF